MTTTPEAPGPSRRTAWLLPVGLPVLLAIALIVLLVVAARFWYERRHGDDGVAAALTAGRTAALTLFDLDHAHVRGNVERMLDQSTGSFRSEYARQRARLETQVTSKQLTVSPTVPENGVAVEFFSPRRAQVLVAVNTTTTLPGGRSEKASYRTRVVLSRVGDRWLVAGLEQVG